MYLLTRELTGNRAAAFAAGMYCAFGPLRMSQICAHPAGGHRLDPVRALGTASVFLDEAISLARRLCRVVGSANLVQYLRRLLHRGADRDRRSSTVLSARRARGPRLLLQLAAAGLLVAAALAPAALAYYRARTSPSPGARRRGDRGQQPGPPRLRRGQEEHRCLAVAADCRRDRSRKGIVPGLFARLSRRSASCAAAGDPVRRRWIVVYGIAAIVAVTLRWARMCGYGARRSPSTVHTAGCSRSCRDGRHARAGAFRNRRHRRAVGAAGLRRRLADRARRAPALRPLIPAACIRDGRRGWVGRADRNGAIQRARASGRSRRRVLAGRPRSRAPCCICLPARKPESRCSTISS